MQGRHTNAKFLIFYRYMAAYSWRFSLAIYYIFMMMILFLLFAFAYGIAIYAFLLFGL